MSTEASRPQARRIAGKRPGEQRPRSGWMEKAGGNLDISTHLEKAGSQGSLLISLTGHGSEQAAKEGMGFGAFDYMTKSCDLVLRLQNKMIKSASIGIGRGGVVVRSQLLLLCFCNRTVNEQSQTVAPCHGARYGVGSLSCPGKKSKTLGWLAAEEKAELRT